MNRKKFHFDNVYAMDTKKYGSINLLQIGDIACGAVYRVPGHLHRCYEITLIAEGKAVCGQGDKKYNLKKGDVHVCLPGDIHFISSDNIEPVRYFYFAFLLDEGSEFEQITEYFNSLHDFAAKDKFDLQKTFTAAFAEIKTEEAYSQRLLKNLIENLLINTYRCFVSAERTAYTTHGGAENIVYDIVNYIDNNISGVSSLAEVAEKFGYSYNYISNMFSTVMGVSLKHYVNGKRFEMAASMLEKTDSSITDIAAGLNFKSIHTFSRAFKNYTGISPAEYRLKGGEKI